MLTAVLTPTKLENGVKSEPSPMPQAAKSESQELKSHPPSPVNPPVKPLVNRTAHSVPESGWSLWAVYLW